MKSFIIYMATSNDFEENDKKDLYPAIKSKFGSIYDGKYYSPLRSQWYNNIKMFIGDKMYLTTKTIVQLDLLKTSLQQGTYARHRTMDKNQCLRKSTRALKIYEASISQARETENHVFYMGVHPSTDNFEFTEKIEKCIATVVEGKTMKSVPRIKLIQIHKFIRNANPHLINNASNRFKRDGHYSVAGHKNIANALNATLIRDLIGNK